MEQAFVLIQSSSRSSLYPNFEVLCSSVTYFNNSLYETDGQKKHFLSDLLLLVKQFFSEGNFLAIYENSDNPC